MSSVGMRCDALDHVADDLAGGVPDAEVLAELGVESFEEGLVEVLDCIGLRKLREKGGAVAAGEGVAGEVEHFGELRGVERAAVGDLGEELAEDGDVKVAGGGEPVEAGTGSLAVGAAPEDPGGEDAIEEGLDEGGAKKCSPFRLRSGGRGIAQAHS